jgi:ABC-type proline/glycine betaine transport system substrate-binding protein
MRYVRSLTALLALCIAEALSTSTQAAEIVIGNPETPYETRTDAVLKTVLENRPGVQVGAIVASGAVVFKAMDASKGAIDIDPGVQMPDNQSFYDEYVTRRRTVVAGAGS